MKEKNARKGRGRERNRERERKRLQVCYEEVANFYCRVGRMEKSDPESER